MKSVCMWSFCDPYFPVFGRNTERYFEVSLRIKSKGGKIRTRKTSNTDALHPVLVIQNSVIQNGKKLILISAYHVLKSTELK